MDRKLQRLISQMEKFQEELEVKQAQYELLEERLEANGEGVKVAKRAARVRSTKNHVVNQWAADLINQTQADLQAQYDKLGQEIDTLVAELDQAAKDAERHATTIEAQIDEYKEEYERANREYRAASKDQKKEILASDEMKEIVGLYKSIRDSEDGRLGLQSTVDLIRQIQGRTASVKNAWETSRTSDSLETMLEQTELQANANDRKINASDYIDVQVTEMENGKYKMTVTIGDRTTVIENLSQKAMSDDFMAATVERTLAVANSLENSHTNHDFAYVEFANGKAINGSVETLTRTIDGTPGKGRSNQMVSGKQFTFDAEELDRAMDMALVSDLASRINYSKVLVKLPHDKEEIIHRNVSRVITYAGLDEPNLTDEPDLTPDQPDLPGNQPDLPGDQPDLPGDQPDLTPDQPDLPGDQPDLPGGDGDGTGDGDGSTAGGDGDAPENDTPDDDIQVIPGGDGTGEGDTNGDDEEELDGEDIPEITDDEPEVIRTVPQDNGLTPKLLSGQVQTILNKIQDGVLATNRDVSEAELEKYLDSKKAGKLNAINLRVRPRGLKELAKYYGHLARVPKAIVGIVTFLPATLIKGIVKTYGYATTSYEQRDVWESYKNQVNALTEDEKYTLLHELTTTDIGNYGITRTVAVLLRDSLSQWALRKAQNYTLEAFEIENQIINDVAQIEELSKELNTEGVTPEREAQIYTTIEALTAGKADQIKRARDLRSAANGLINGGAQGLRQAMDDWNSKQNFGGLHFDRGPGYSVETNRAQALEEQNLEAALNGETEYRDLDAMLAFAKGRQIISDATVLNVFGAHKKESSRQVTMLPEELSHEKDTFYADMLRCAMIGLTAYTIGREMTGTMTDVQNQQIVDDYAANVRATTNEAAAQIQATGNQITAENAVVQQGYAASIHANSGLAHAGAEVTALDKSAIVGNGPWDLASATYKDADGIIHGVIEPREYEYLTEITKVDALVKNGTYSVGQAMQKTAEILRDQSQSLQEQCFNATDIISTYAQTHDFNYDAFVESITTLGKSAEAMGAGAMSSANIQAYADALKQFNIQVADAPQLMATQSDALLPVLSGATTLGLLTSGFQNTIGKSAQELSEEELEALGVLTEIDIDAIRSRTL